MPSCKAWQLPCLMFRPRRSTMCYELHRCRQNRHNAVAIDLPKEAALTQGNPPDRQIYAALSVVFPVSITAIRCGWL